MIKTTASFSAILFLFTATLAFQPIDRIENNALKPAAFGITHGPYVQQISETSATIIWCTSYRYSMPIVLWGTDSTISNQTTSLHDGLIDLNLDHQSVTLSGLQPGTRYFYRVTNKKVNLWSYHAIMYGSTVESEIYEFTTLDREKSTVSFVVLNDLSVNISRMDSLLAHTLDDSVDFIVLNGNMLSSIDGQEQIYTDLFDSCCRLFAQRIPFYFVRGVQECRGVYARELHKYLGSESVRYYSSFAHGGVQFILLDSGEKHADSAAQYAGLTDFEAYRREQREWLEQTVTSSDYLAAKHRIVFSHLPVYGGGDNFAQNDMRAHWATLLDQGHIDLYISGSSDHYVRIAPTSNQNSYPILIGAGAGNGEATAIRVDISEKGIEVRVVRENGSLVDSFELGGTAVEQPPQILPDEFSLGQNYPNPFNPTTQIDYTLPATGPVQCKLYNSIGQKVRTLVDGVQCAGTYTVAFDARGLPSGIYTYVLTAGNLSHKKKMVLLH
ncbi:T9SS type A sorting domain-containing protein [candidate division KSB1 bacterium]|nr:T9SS type A sorting domain-containing protein [candidate division KSB1 bacterium]